MQLTRSLKAPGFNALSLSSEKLVSKFTFQMQPAALHRGVFASHANRHGKGDFGGGDDGQRRGVDEQFEEVSAAVVGAGDAQGQLVAENRPAARARWGCTS